MTIDEIKSASLISYLAAHNYTLTKQHRNQYWYLSPLHEEKNASFKVNTDSNLWFDFGLNKGGNIITLAKELNPGLSMHEVLKKLEQEIRDLGLLNGIAIDHTTTNFRQTYEKSPIDKTEDTIVERLIPIRHYHLKSYLLARRIDFSVAETYCKEVHYQLRHTDKTYYGIAFENVDGGMEVRNKFFKRCIGKKTYSYIRSNASGISRACCVFEGFFDFLTYMSFKKRGDSLICIEAETDYIILNSVAVVKRTFDVLKLYSTIHCFLDNDKAGQDATQIIKDAFPDTSVDESSRYSGYEDINDVILGKVKT